MSVESLPALRGKEGGGRSMRLTELKTATDINRKNIQRLSDVRLKKPRGGEEEERNKNKQKKNSFLYDEEEENQGGEVDVVVFSLFPFATVCQQEIS